MNGCLYICTMYVCHLRKYEMDVCMYILCTYFMYVFVYVFRYVGK